MQSKTKARTSLKLGSVIIVSALTTALLAPMLGQRPALATTTVAAPPLAQAPVQLADLIERVQPSVVNISTARDVTPPVSSRDRRGSDADEFFRRFFESPPGPRSRAPTRGEGSGFVIEDSGYVVTNNHVIEGADEIVVTLHDGTRLDAELVGRDPKTDLALLKVDSDTSLPAVSFGNSDRARVGDWVVAIGNPFGLGGTATAGIISARGRDIQSGPFDDFIQIDAPINRGNSGGPVFNTAGEVIGINTAIYSPNGGSVGIGFAIPAAQAESIVAQLRDSGDVERGWLGVQIQSVSEDIADSLGLENDNGALVADVVPDSPAADADLRPGDVILSFNGKSIGDIKDLTRTVAQTAADERVPVQVYRDGDTHTLEVVIGRLDEPRSPMAENRADHLGFSLAPLTDSLRERLRLPEETEGALIVEVTPGTAAAAKGLRRGDVIARAGNTTIAAPRRCHACGRCRPRKRQRQHPAAGTTRRNAAICRAQAGLRKYRPGQPRTAAPMFQRHPTRILLNFATKGRG